MSGFTPTGGNAWTAPDDVQAYNDTAAIPEINTALENGDFLRRVKLDFVGGNDPAGISANNCGGVIAECVSIATNDDGQGDMVLIDHTTDYANTNMEGGSTALLHRYCTFSGVIRFSNNPEDHLPGHIEDYALKSGESGTAEISGSFYTRIGESNSEGPHVVSGSVSGGNYKMYVKTNGDLICVWNNTGGHGVAIRINATFGRKMESE